MPYLSISELAGQPGFPKSYNGTKNFLDAKGYTTRSRVKGKGVEYLVGLETIKSFESKPTPTKNFYTIETLFEKLQGKPGIPQTVSGLRRKIKKEGWESRPRAAKGGGLEYLAPKDLFVEERKLYAVPDIDLTAPTPISAGVARRDYRLSIVQQCSEWCDNNGIEISRTEGGKYWTAIEQFVTAYNSQYPDKPAINTHTVARWWLMGIQKNEPMTLAGKYGQHLVGKNLIDKQPVVAAICLQMIGSRASHVLQQIKWLAIDEPKLEIKVPSYQTLVRWRTNWKLNNHAAWIEIVEGKSAWKNKIRPSIGNHEATHANEQWEMDGTTIDVMAADGKRYRLMTLIDVFSRKFTYVLVDSANGEAAYGQALFKAICEMGIPETITTDNGKEYKNSRGLVVSAWLGFILRFCHARSPWEKPFVERLNGTINTRLLETLPGAVGNNVETRKRLEQTKLKDDGRRLTKEEIIKHLDAFQADYHNRIHSELKMTPNQKWASTPTDKPIKRIDITKDAAALQLLLNTNLKERTVGKKGITFNNGNYFDLEGRWTDRIGTTVAVQAAPDGRLYVYSDMDKPELIFVAREKQSLRPDEMAQALDNAKKESRGTVKKAKQEIAKTKKVFTPRTYLDMAPDNVVPFESHEPIEPEILEESHSAIEQINAEKQLAESQAIERAKTLAAITEPNARKYGRLINTPEADLNEFDRKWLAHYVTTSEGQIQHGFAHDDEDLVVAR